MIELKTLGGESIELFTDTKITFIRRNPFFLDDRVYITMRSLNFSLPRSPINDKILNHFAEASSYYRSSTVVFVDVIVSGNLFMKAEMTVLRSPENAYNVVLTRRYTEFKTDLRLRELDLPTQGSSNFEQRNNDFGKTWPEVPFVYPMFQNSRDLGYGLRPEFDNEPDTALRPANWFGGASQTNSSQDLAVPMFFLPWVIKEVVKASGQLYAGGAFLQDDRILNKVIFNTTCTNDSIIPAKLSIITTPNRFFTQQRIQVTHILHNLRATGRGYRSTPDNLIRFSKDWFVFEVGTRIKFTIYEIDPFLLTTINSTDVTYTTTSFDTDQLTLLTNIGNHLIANVPNITLLGTGFSNEAQLQSLDIGWNNHNKMSIIGAVETDPVAFERNRAIIEFEGISTFNDIKPTMHLPDITVGDLFTQIAGFFNLAIYLNERRDELVFVPRINTLTADRLDVSKFVFSNFDKEEKPVMNLWLEFEKDSNDKIVSNLNAYADNYPEMKLSPLTKVTVKCATLPDNKEIVNSVTSPFGPFVTWTYAQVPLVEMDFGTYNEPKPFSLRLLNHEGIVFDTGGYQYLTASNKDLTPNEVFLEWHFDWYQFVKHPGRWFWFKFDFDLNFLLNFSPAKSWQVLNNAYVWEEMRITISMDSIEETEVKMLKL